MVANVIVAWPLSFFCAFTILGRFSFTPRVTPEIHLKYYNSTVKRYGDKTQVAQWFSMLAAMAMLSTRTWGRVPPITSGVFHL